MLVSLSTLLRGTTHEKLRWTFTLYDLNGDGFITKQEVLNVMVAVHDLMGFHGTPMREVVEPNVDEIFNRLDTNRDGVVTIDEFIHACQTMDYDPFWVHGYLLDGRVKVVTLTLVPATKAIATVIKLESCGVFDS
ncbi:hypothetical protein TCAL_14724 [Tigriopus californicus]|uniref:EF-hand domain-containing protein n=1 Tax=Tigriopus californicus TaxID=6832 RepID=A0A553PGT1_TIGCA|nr:hypothetical protein TCAL_14724 [Tigriopus californicus]